MNLPSMVRIPSPDGARGPWVAASRWCRNGDHPCDGAARSNPNVEGRTVRRFRRPDKDDMAPCGVCGALFHEHGWIERGDVVVCPGSYVVNYPDGTYSTLSAERVAAMHREDAPERRRT